MKRISIILAFIIMAMSLAACTDNSQAEITQPEASKTEEAVAVDTESSTSESETTIKTDPVCTSTPYNYTPKLPSRNPDELSMTDYVGASLKDVIEVLGEDVEILIEDYQGLDAFAYYNDYTFGLTAEGTTEEEIKETAVIYLVANARGKKPLSVNGEYDTNITYAETLKLTKQEPVLHQGEEGISSVYEYDGMTIVFNWETLHPDADEKPTIVEVYKSAE